MAEKRSSVLFNKNASPFYPAAVQPPPPLFPPYQGPDVVLTNVPQVSKQELHDFLAAQMLAAGGHVVDLTPGHAVVRFAVPGAAQAAVETLEKCIWLGHTLHAALASPQIPLVSQNSQKSQASQASQAQPSQVPASQIPQASQAPPAPPGHDETNPYFFMPPLGYPVDYGYYGAPMYPPYGGYYGVSPVATRTPSRRSSTRLILRQSSVGYKPLPPFVLNMVKRPELTGESTPEDDLELLEIEDDDGNTIKVNPRRLFVGNIPFNLTWPALKNFLITKAEEIEPGNSIEIHRVEIPMQQPRDAADAAKLNSYQFLPLLSQQLHDGSVQPTPEPPRASSVPGPTRGLSRGFAIVTTGNKMSLDKIIKYFDNVEFEGRTLTVRYDRFPDFNNYVLQQLYPSSKNGQGNKPAFLSNLAFERNSFQQKFYYGNSMSPYNYRVQQPFKGEFTVDELQGPLDEIEIEISGDQTEITQHASDDEKARDLVNSFATQDLSA